MKMIQIPCRYYRVYTDPHVPCVESNFHHVERRLPIPVEQTALVLVDVWSTHYIESWLQRAAEVVQSKIVPLLKAARDVGMTIVHAPSPFVVERRGYGGVQSPTAPSGPDSDHEWPPAEFRSIYRSGKFGGFGRRQEPRLSEAMARYETELDIAASAKPLPGERVVSTGEQLHSLLAERGVLHLFYAGFAANWCVLHRDYGVIAMAQRGYNLILVRDATTGIEFHDTVHTLAATQTAIREIETKWAWSATTTAMIEACTQAE